MNRSIAAGIMLLVFLAFMVSCFISLRAGATARRVVLPPIYCQPEVIVAMDHIWEQTEDGESIHESTFVINGTPKDFAIYVEPYTNEDYGEAISIFPGRTFAVFHVHPNVSGAEPSETDRRLADEKHLDVYTVTNRGLYRYAWRTRKTTKVREYWADEKGCS
jgi:proteasome lid subunit RPN8/RPN11